MPLSLPALMTLLAVMWLILTGVQVARMRGKHRIEAPATTGHPAFERAFRVQMNELENLVAFLPAMWIFAWFGNPRLAGIAAAVYIVGRVVYAIGYWTEAGKRHVGYLIASITLLVTWVAALVSVVPRLGFA